MAVPKITETRCSDGSVLARQAAKDNNPIIFIRFSASFAMRLLGTSMCS